MSAFSPRAACAAAATAAASRPSPAVWRSPQRPRRLSIEARRRRSATWREPTCHRSRAARWPSPLRPATWPSETVVKNAARHLGLAVANVVNLLAPDVVILGGGLVEALPEIFLSEVRKAVNSQAMEAFTKDLRSPRPSSGTTRPSWELRHCGSGG